MKTSFLKQMEKSLTARKRRFIKLLWYCMHRDWSIRVTWHVRILAQRAPECIIIFLHSRGALKIRLILNFLDLDCHLFYFSIVSQFFKTDNALMLLCYQCKCSARSVSSDGAHCNSPSGSCRCGTNLKIYLTVHCIYTNARSSMHFMYHMKYIVNTTRVLTLSYSKYYTW